MITRLQETPPGVGGLWATLDDGSIYHIVEHDDADLAIALRNYLNTNTMNAEPYEDADDLSENAAIDQVNAQLKAAGVPALVESAEDVADAKAYLALKAQRELEVAADRFSENFIEAI